MSSPLPSSSRSPSQRPTSIESALELERDLAMDTSTISGDDHTSTRNSGDPEFDTEILSHLVIQLRMEVAKVTSQRDDAIAALSEATLSKACLDAKAADYADELDLVKMKVVSLEQERDDALRRAQSEEEQVTVLREKVEEARRGVMRLQAENRRQMAANKLVPLDLSQASSRTMNGPPSVLTSAKRSSFILGSGPPPRSAQGAGHRRISSMSDTAVMNGFHTPGNPATADQEFGYIPSSPASPTFENSISGSGSTIKTKRLSLLTRRDEPAINPLAFELEATRAELASTRQDLIEAKKDLQEAADARVANEVCLKALKSFIEEHSIGHNSPSAGDASPRSSLKGLRLPPLPSDINDEDEESQVPQQPKRSGWASLKLWRENSNPSIPSCPPSASTLNSTPNPDTSSSTPLTNFVATWTRSVSASSQNVPSAPLASPSSLGTSSSTSPPPLQQNNSFTKKFPFFGNNKAVTQPSAAPVGSEFTVNQESTKSSPDSEVASLPSMVNSSTPSDVSEPSSPLNETDLVKVIFSPAPPVTQKLESDELTPALSDDIPRTRDAQTVAV